MMRRDSGDYTESIVEQSALAYFEGLGYQVLAGPDIGPDGSAPERDDYRTAVLVRRLRDALVRLNPDVPSAALDEAQRLLLLTNSPSLTANNQAAHQQLIEGISVGLPRGDGSTVYHRVKFADFEQHHLNDWLVVNQFTVAEGNHERRPDIVVFLNGLPVAVFELKSPTGASASIWTAFSQLQTYRQQVPSLFTHNELLVISDGREARVGSLTADKERFVPWRTLDGETLAPAGTPQLQVLVQGLFEKRLLLQFIRHFVVFEAERETVQKKIAAYHQFHAVNTALEATVQAISPDGSRQIGVVWHTQGSGKSLTMLYYAGRLTVDPRLNNPTLLVLTDRNDLDDQLFGTFSRGKELLRQTPRQAETRDELKPLFLVASGGVIFSTIQKFLPEGPGLRYPILSERRNVIVIVDEAHRSQYNFGARLDTKTGEQSYGLAQHLRDALPLASFIGFTGTPIDRADANTRGVFGEYLDVYDIQRAVDDGSTVPIYYESRLIRLGIEDEERLKAEAAFEEATEGEEQAGVQRLTTRWTRLEALAGTPERLREIAADLVKHFQNRQDAMQGKAMIVCMSRRICVDLYEQLVALRPEWHGATDAAGEIKVVMTGSASDPQAWQQHIRPKRAREDLANRFKDPDDAFRIVIVRDMWLTGFDAPSLHTMYLDKPMQGHGLMQAIARVNRVFRDKPGGLVVDYLGLGSELRKALATYTLSGGTGSATISQAEAVAQLQEKLERVQALFHGLDYQSALTGTAADRLGKFIEALEFVLALDDGKQRLTKLVTELSHAFALAVPAQEALDVREEVAFFQAIRATLTKPTASAARSADDRDHAIRQIIDRAVTSQGVMDIFQAAGLGRPDLSILSDEFLAEVRDLPQRNLAVEALSRLLNDQVRARTASNVVQARKFSERLEAAIASYHNKAIQTAQVIEELITLALEMRAARERGEQLGLSEAEIAFYDALEASDGTVAALGDDVLKTIARDLVETVQRNASIDWTLRESARAKLRVMVKRVLRKYKYPPEKTDDATATVIRQAELFANAQLTGSG